MTIEPSDLRKIPLFQSISDDHLSELVRAFERVRFGADEILFEAGSRASHLQLLVDGEVALVDGESTRFLLAPIAPIGELGALTGLPRNTMARTTRASEVLQISVDALMEFFEHRGDIAFPFHHNLLRIVAEKLRRDALLIDEMRANLIHTQRAMKKLCDVVLEAEETALSQSVCETLEPLIERNRRAHYMVTPAFVLATWVRLDGGALSSVSAMSDGWIRLADVPSGAPEVGAPWSGVLVLPDVEFPVSGVVETAGPDGLLVKIDLLIDAYQTALTAHLTRVQMLDFVV